MMRTCTVGQELEMGMAVLFCDIWPSVGMTLLGLPGALGEPRCLGPTLEFLIGSPGGAWESACPTGSQVLLPLPQGQLCVAVV